MTLIEKILFKFGYIKFQRPTATQVLSMENARKASIQNVTVGAEFPIGIDRHSIANELIPKLGEAMLPYVQEETYWNKEQRICRFTWRVDFAINPCRNAPK